MKTYYTIQYSVDGKTWLGFMDRHATLAEADRVAESKRNEELELRICRVTVERIKRFPRKPGTKARPVILPGLGVLEVSE